MSIVEFDIPRRSLNWAKEAIQESHVVLGSFYARVETVEFTDIDPKTGLHHFKVRLSENIPDRIDRRVFEAISQTRNAFDQALFAACCAVNKRPKDDLHFPWRSSPEDLRRKLENTKKPVPSEFWEIIRNHHPYPRSDAYTGGDDHIREIARIANQKHTVSISTTGFVDGGRLPNVRSLFPGSSPEAHILSPKWDAVKNEMTLVIYAGKVVIQNNYNFAFHLVFQENGPLKNVPVLPMLDAFAAKAETVINDLEAECRKIRGS